jgi:5-methylcytosine-specific restriction endonuclease McrA
LEKCSERKRDLFASDKRKCLGCWKKATKNDQTEHVIHKKNGRIGEKNSYGNDPNPPRNKK